jgi:N-alpha-acetyltransferase 40
MAEPATRFLVLQEPNQGALLGFLSWQVDMEDDAPVIYWYLRPISKFNHSYELQLHSSLRRCGIGRQFVHVLEQLGSKLRLSKVMLTVFSSNISALSFYTKLGYSIDIDSG